MNDALWIWQQPEWPHFSWQAEALACAHHRHAAEHTS
ncbi:DUF4172 domain-containing protein [Pseudomonas juntendi]